MTQTYNSHYNLPQRYMPIYVFSALLTIARKQNQPRCLSKDEQIMKMWHIYKVELYSDIRKIYIIRFASNWVDPKKVFYK